MRSLVALRGEPLVIEREQRFSLSIVWEMQRRFYAERGLDAWRSQTVTEHVTATPALADAFARVVHGHLRDRVNRLERTYIVELGGGTGRFAHYFLERLVPRLEAMGALAPVTYVLTDVVPSLLEHWRAHPCLVEYIARGVLDLAVFDAAAPAPLVLIESGVTLGPGTCAAPLVVIANDVLGELPADCFRVADGVLTAGLSTLSVMREIEDPTEPALLGELALRMSDAPVGAAYYGEPVRDAILEGYRARLVDTSVLMPIAAMRCLDYLRAIGGGAFALIADRGIADERGLEDKLDPQLELHGGFSVRLNLHALAAYVRATGGRVYQSDARHPRLEVLALAVGMPEAGLETACAFRDAIELDSPGDALTRRESAARGYDDLSLDEILAELRRDGGDLATFWACYRELVESVASASAEQREDVTSTLARLWASYFPTGEPEDFALALATVHDQLGEFEEARWYADHSIRLRGPSAEAGYQLARCHAELGDLEQASHELAQVLARQPDHDGARALAAALHDATPQVRSSR